MGLSSAIGGSEPRRAFYFGSKETAQAFTAQLGKGGNCRYQGKPACRATLHTRKRGNAIETDTRHIGGFTVFVQPWSFGDAGQMANLARDMGCLRSPFEV